MSNNKFNPGKLYKINWDNPEIKTYTLQFLGKIIGMESGNDYFLLNADPGWFGRTFGNIFLFVEVETWYKIEGNPVGLYSITNKTRHPKLFWKFLAGEQGLLINPIAKLLIKIDNV